MKKTFGMALAAASLTLAGATASTAADMVTTYQEEDARNGVKIGYLDCDIGGGVGYVLGWTWLIREQLEAGTLVPVHDHMMRSDGRFYLMRPADRHQRRVVREVSDWLIANNVNNDA